MVRTKLATALSTVLLVGSMFGGQAFAKSDEHNKQMDFYNAIKNDPDFKILDDYGNGTFTYTASDRIKTNEDKDKFRVKVNKIKAQTTHTVTVEALNRTAYDGGNMETWFKDTETDNSADPENMQVTGQWTHQWFQGTSKTANWDKLYNVKDEFVVGYDYVSSQSLSASVSMSGPSGAYSATITSTQATIPMSWEDKGPYFYYGASYGTLQATAPNITRYTHTASAQASIAGYQVATSAYKSVAVN